MFRVFLKYLVSVPKPQIQQRTFHLKESIMREIWVSEDDYAQSHCYLKCNHPIYLIRCEFIRNFEVADKDWQHAHYLNEHTFLLLNLIFT